MKYTRILCTILLFVAGFLFITNTALAAPTNFVTTSGRHFYVNGKVVTSIGVNKYNLLTIGGHPYIGCGGKFSDSELATWFSELSQMGVTSVRFWLFQSFTKSGTDLSRFNYVLSLAQQYNIRVVPVFENQWQDCTQGGKKDANWYRNGYRAPYGTYSLSLKDYIGKVVPLYRNNPQILMWQIMNEAESSDGNALLTFAKDVSSYIKSLDSNHLVSFGTVGSGQPGSHVYKNIHELSSIDVLEYHDYNEETTAFPASLSRRFHDSETINKPLFIGEAGISLSKYTPEQRATYLDKKIASYFEHGGDVYMIWSYRDANGEEKSFDFTLSDPLVPIIEKYTHAQQQIPTISMTTTPAPSILPQKVLGVWVKPSPSARCGLNIPCYIRDILYKLHVIK